MSDIIIGLLTGLLTSFFVGLFLIWKGDYLVKNLQRIPIKWRIRLLTKVYLSALNDYPLRYLNSKILSLFIAFHLFFSGAYVLITIILFKIAGEGKDNIPEESIKDIDPSVVLINPWVPWILLCFTLFVLYFSWGALKETFVAVVLPYAYRELNSIRECVKVAASAEDFIKYVNMETQCKSKEAILEMMEFSIRILGENSLKLPTEIISSLTDKDWSGIKAKQKG
ncbi:hypothetical protein [Marinobacterium iners]|uniref:Uncharacterized protein n=1 Tax=Marinobacterium iners DSM 11526 TaxID=1122198 RepID=A0A1H4HBW3_9GAMM|nr:hypothetical protein [Marinobacterium iners]SEB18602.1 hypothetical protein SAMN02745729_13511 [Marinobacterium iners DSM 11526]